MSEDHGTPTPLARDPSYMPVDFDLVAPIGLQRRVGAVDHVTQGLEVVRRRQRDHRCPIYFQIECDALKTPNYPNIDFDAPRVSD